METKEKTVTETKMITIKLSDIEIGKSNPRKDFDEESINDLAESIREKGLIQPITVRPSKTEGKYELVCGERRYRASMIVKTAIKTRDSIAAVVRSLTDQEVLELQIIENLQRKDVHPIEEANAFKNLIDFKIIDITEIAKRMGKKSRYVAERLKSNDLIEKFQKAFYKNQITLDTALKISKLSVEDQNELWEEDGEGVTGKINIQQYQLNKFLGNLLNAPFDTKDETLNKTMGACSLCPHNTAANTLLFPDEAGNAKCVNSPCFKLKASVYFERELQKVISDPTIELVSTEYHQGKDANALIAKGHTVLQKYKNFEIESKPEAPDLEEYKQDLEDENFDDEADMMKNYERELKSYNEDLADYNKEIATGKFIKAFVVEGSDRGQYIYIKLKKDSSVKTSAKAVSAKTKDGTVTAENIKAEISRLQEKEKRNVELDGEKNNLAFHALLKKNKAIKENTGALKISEKVGAIILLSEYGGHTSENAIFKAAGISSSNYDYKKIALYNKIVKFTDTQLDKLIATTFRALFIDKLETTFASPSTNGKAAVLSDIINIYDLKGAQAIRKAQDDEAKKRNERVATKIASLKKQMPVTPVKKASAGPIKKVKSKK